MTADSTTIVQAPPLDDHLVPLGSGPWALWQDVALRSTGFPAHAVDRLCDPELAVAADEARCLPADEARYRRTFADACARLSAAVRAVAGEPRFREAVAWQNPAILRNCLDKAARGEPRNSSGRNHELTIAGYLQRYTYKNDTIGFFGPVCWARIDPASDGLVVRPGPRLLRRRTTYLEVWAIDALASALSARDDVRAWLRPRRNAACGLHGRVLRVPMRRPVPLSAPEAHLMALCDGTRTTPQVLAAASRPTAAPQADAFDDVGAARTALERLRELGAVQVDLAVPMHSRPEAILEEQLRQIDDPTARSSALAPLHELVAARDAVDRAAGDAEEIAATTAALAEVFVEHTGVAASRNHGRTYAGRTLLYQDTVRDVEVTIGRTVLQAAALPLGLLLDSVRWLAGQAAERYQDLFLRLFTAHLRGHRGRRTSMPLPQLLLVALPEVLTSPDPGRTPLVAGVVADFQQRWAGVLRVPAGARRHDVDATSVAAAVAEAFPPGPLRWSNARMHSPDLMIAAPDVQAVLRGAFTLVLGEIHLTTNTLESRLFVEQHEEPARLLAAATADARGRRIYAVPPKRSPYLTSRLSPPTALLSEEFTYWCTGEDAAGCPVTPLAAADLDVHRDGDRLVVRHRGSARTFDLLEILGEILTLTVANAYELMPPVAHRPRVSLDRLVIQRETWSVSPKEAGWAFLKDECDRFAAARSWIAEHGMPERAFFKVPVERKPTMVDFTSLPMVNMLAKSIRHTAAKQAGDVILTELLPGPEQLWLSDADGHRYACELRVVAVDQHAEAVR